MTSSLIPECKGDRIYYTYAWLREDGKPYYIGKGKRYRAWTQHGNRKPPPKSRVLILKKGLTEEEAHRHEKYMIHVLGRKDLGKGILWNFTDGGEGVSGLVGLAGEENPFFGKSHSQETVEVMREKKTGKNNPNFGKPRDPETRRKIGVGNSGPSKNKSLSKMGDKNPQKGKSWWTNGVQSRCSFDCPEGWYKGRTL